MKTKVWVFPPSCIIVPILMIMMALVSLNWNFILFLIQLSLAIIALAIAIIEMYRFKTYVKTTSGDVEKHFQLVNIDHLERVPFPAAIVGQYDDIISVNKHFNATIGENKNFEGQAISTLLSGHKMSDVLRKKSIDIMYAGKQYTVFGVPFEKSSIVYFMDDTYYKETTHEYIESRPAVCIAVFDNREEILPNNKGGYDTQIVARVEQELQNFTNETSGFMKKLDNKRYMIIMEDRHVKSFMESKFSVLEKIREIKIDDRQYATISMGVSRMAPTLNESEKWAQNALNMALGRGGDQVAIRQNDSYKFFGGKSKGVEKRDKVRTRVIAATLSGYIKSSDIVLIMGHKFSDLDSVGAAIGMCGTINKALNVRSHVVIDPETSLATPIINMIKNSGNKNFFITPSVARGMVTEKTLLIVVDTHSENFLEDKKLYEKCKNVVVIDHHRMMVEHIKNAVVFYHEPYASSASEMVTELIQYLSENSIGNVEAEALLAGIMLDTKNFVLKTGVRTFEAAAFLKRKGADTVEVKKLFSNSFDTYKEKASLVSTAKIVDKCAITFTKEDSPIIRVACAQAADELLTIKGISASYVIYPSKSAVNISARSLGDVNVQLVMEKLGGGGHQNMAGAQINNTTVENVKNKLIDIIHSSLTE